MLSSVRLLPSSRSGAGQWQRGALARDHVLHELGDLGFAGREAADLVEMLLIVEYIREDHGVPSREGHL
jgi:hypothetical protein